MKIAIVGCGAAAERYYVPAIKKHPEIITQLHLVDQNRAQAKKLSRLIGGGRIVTDHKDAVNSVDGAIISLPNFLHHPIAMDFLNAGIHVLCEKPLAASFKQAKEMVEAAATNNVNICVNNTRRMFPSSQAIHRILAKKELGRVKSIKYSEGGAFGWASATGFYVDPKVSSKGLVSDVGPHVLDLICWWLGGVPTLRECLDDSFGGPESVAKIVAGYDEGQIEIFMNRLVDLDNSFEILCELGRIQGKPMEWNRIFVKKNSSRIEEKKLPCKEKNYPSFVYPIFRNFLKVLGNMETPLISGADVLDSIEFIDTCYTNRKRFSLPWYDRIQVSAKKKNSHVLITGATGFIGGGIAERLFLSKTRGVRAVVHNWSNAARIGRFPIEIVHMDLMQPESINRTLDGVTEIIHCAKGPYDVTVYGTENLLEAAYRKGIKRVVHLSTTEVYGNTEGEVSERAPFDYTGNEYNRMKIDAEKVCWKYKEKGLPISILRPSIVYGPFSKNWTIHFAKMLIDRNIGIYDTIGNGKCNLVYIDDLISALLLALTHEKAAGEAFNIIGPDVVSWNEFLNFFNQSLMLPPIKIIGKSTAGLKASALMPVRKMGGIVRDHFMGPIKKIAEIVPIADYMLRKVEHTLKTTPATDDLRLFNKKSYYIDRKAKAILGYSPTVSITDGLSLSAEWLFHQAVHNLQ